MAFEDLPLLLGKPEPTDMQELLSSQSPAQPSLEPVMTEIPKEPSFFDEVQKKVWDGFLGTPIPRLGVSAALGATVGAGFGGVGAIPGALLGAAAGVLTDYLGATADIATQKAVGPEGLEIGNVTISPELAGTMADLTTGLVGGLGLFRAAGKLGTKLAPKALSIPASQAQGILPWMMPTDPRNWMRLPPQVKEALSSLENKGMKFGLDEVEFSADQLKEWMKLEDMIMSPLPGAASTEGVLGAFGRGSSKIREIFTNRLLRFAAAPRHVMLGDRAGETILHSLASGGMLSRSVRYAFSNRYKEAIEGISEKDLNLLADIWLNTQGRAAKKVAGAAPHKGQLTLFDDAPGVAPRLAREQHVEIMREYLRRIGRDDLLPVHDKLSGVLGDMGDTLVSMGKLKPEDLIDNYLPFIRETARAEQSRVVRLGEGYRPLYIDNMVPKHAKAFMLNERRFDVPPKDVTLDHIFQTYIGAFSKLIGRESVLSHVEQLLPMIEDSTRAAYGAQLFNIFMGAPGSGPEQVARHAAEIVKKYQFWRTLGGSVLTAVVNSAQRLNVLGYVGPKHWARALIPNKTFVERAKQLGLLDEGLNMADISAMDATYQGIRKGAKGILGLPFFVSERGNILHAFQAGMYQALERGLPMRAAEEWGRMIAEQTQFVTRIGRTPTGIASSAMGGVIGQFKTFMMNQAAFTERVIRQNPKGAVQFLMANALLFGTDAVAPGADMKATRAIFGKPFKVFPGLVGYAGIALAEQVSVFGLDPDDFKRLAMFLPGPAMEHAQLIGGAMLGINLGSGLDFEKFGLPMTPDERAQAILRAAPFGGAAANRLRKAAKLFQAGKVDRAALDLVEAFGFTPATGPLKRAGYTFNEAGLHAFGLMPTRQYEQDKYLNEIRGIQEEHKILSARAADLIIAGRMAEAQKLMAKFRQKYPEAAYSVMPSRNALQEAMQRRMFTMPQRTVKGAPRALRGAYTPPVLEREQRL